MVQVQGVGDQLRGGVGGAPDPGAQLGGRELGDLRGPVAAEPAGLLPAGPVGVGRVQPGGVVQ